MRTTSRVTLLVAGIAGIGLIAPTAATTGAQAGAGKEKPPQPRHVVYDEFASVADFSAGSFDGTAPTSEGLQITDPVGQRDYTDPFGDGSTTTYDFGTWTSPVVSPGFDYTELISSWNAATPADTWIEVNVRGTAETGATSKWYVLGRWASSDKDLHRTSVSGQRDELATVLVDTLATVNDHTFADWQLRVELYRAAGTTGTPSVRSVGAMASQLPDVKKVQASPSGGAVGKVLDVPKYSQETHIGQYPEYDSGGEAWCSPTSTAMVVDFWDAGPTDHPYPEGYGWVLDDDPTIADPWVDHAARQVFDYTYDGAGNWPFNTAYAATRGLEGFVTRLRSLTEAEQFIKAGIPLIVSVSFKKGELDGAGYGTNGHLMVIVGFAANGDVVVNDPASHLIPSNDQVRFTYDREQFENTWIPHSGGVAYVIHPSSVSLPDAPDEANW
ncbi:MAG TPA: peptidase C39 family protein [Nocardioidaceae bacterium]|nr:peptidase C39 family protein [Nocardioidaceae bacterium]